MKTKFKVGDKLRCIDSSSKYNIGDNKGRGAGWRLGLEILVGSITEARGKGANIYWPASGESLGIYEDALELVHEDYEVY